MAAAADPGSVRDDRVPLIGFGFAAALAAIAVMYARMRVWAAPSAMRG